MKAREGGTAVRSWDGGGECTQLGVILTFSLPAVTLSGRLASEICTRNGHDGWHVILVLTIGGKGESLGRRRFFFFL